MSPQPSHFVGSDVGMAQDGPETGFRYQRPPLLVSDCPQTGCGFMGDLTDKELKNLKPRAKLYKVTDRDGMHAAVTPTGVISFRYQYRVNGRQEVLTIGRYSAEAARKLTRAPDALEYGMEVSLAEARTLLARARRQVERGESPSKAKVEKRTASAAALTFGGWAEAYFKHKADPKSGAEKLADSTLAMRRSVYDRAIAGELSKLKLAEVTREGDIAAVGVHPRRCQHMRPVYRHALRLMDGRGITHYGLYRKRGYGDRVLARLIEASENMELFATIQLKNDSSQRLLARHGFTRTGKSWPSNQADDDVNLYIRQAPEAER